MIWPSIRFDISLQNFKKPLDSFSPQKERKRSKEYLFIILAGKESFEQFSYLEFVFEKSKHREAGLKHKLKGQMNKKIDIFSFVALPSPNSKKNHPKRDLGKDFFPKPL